MEFPVNIKAGRLTFENRPAFDRFLLTVNGKAYLSIKKQRKQRSNPQNRYMWGCVYKLVSDHTGYTTAEVHDLFKRKFLAYEKKGRWFAMSTAQLNTVEFEAYMEEIRRFAAVHLSLYIPEPNEPEWYFYEKEVDGDTKKQAT